MPSSDLRFFTCSLVTGREDRPSTASTSSTPSTTLLEPASCERFTWKPTTTSKENTLRFSSRWMRKSWSCTEVYWDSSQCCHIPIMSVFYQKWFGEKWISTFFFPNETMKENNDMGHYFRKVLVLYRIEKSSRVAFYLREKSQLLALHVKNLKINLISNWWP